METQEIWDRFNNEVYFFILKKVNDKTATGDIFQNTFLKVHKNRSQLQDETKLRAWVFQIARNEIANHFNKESLYVAKTHTDTDTPLQNYQHICCFDKFITDLPKIYRDVIELVYIQGKKQHDAAEILDISLVNVKGRVRRAKDILKKNFNECCKYELDKNGRLTGESNCAVCQD